MFRKLWNKSSYGHLVTRSLDVEIADHAGFTF
jgi:hypothetical protein